ncbi:cytochrome P450 3A27-like [Alosa sapidissima]|uniref:cytochrome P450 3A27-like n=1 Tax=Alosa sapidissima TaxID=34773 RepID=UPI001C08FE5C|nr:cytochrome P450 3A27-like [Alosa sapidissima]
MGYLSFFPTETWTLLFLFLGLLTAYGVWPYRLFKNLGIPGPTPLPFLGTLLEYRKGFTQFDTKCFKKYGKLWGIFDGRQPILSVLDKTIIKTVMVKECYSLFTNRRNLRINGPLNDAVSVVEDDDWRRIRSVLSPSFTSGRLKEMFGIMKTHSKTLVRNLRREAVQGKPVDLKEFVGAYSMDVVTSTAFSVDIDSLNNPNDPFVTNIKELFKFNIFNPFLLLIMFFPFTIPLLEKMNFSLRPAGVMDFFYTSLRKIKAERETSSQKSRVDFLQLMMDSQGSETEGNQREETPNKGLSDHEILSQSLIFIFAGYETTSSTLSFLFYNLATNPETLEKLQQEVDQVFPDKAPVSYEGVMQMEYLDSVLNETLRIFPVVPRVERVSKRTVDINGIAIPKGTVVMVPVYVLHRDPDVWSDPESFKPERFSKENKESIDPYTYMPFGLGPRNCIGMRFALVSMKLVVVEVLQRFTVATCEETQVPMELDNQGLLAPKEPIKLKLIPRTSSHDTSAE